jgi:transcriptional regulator with XRE-family HTH domain
MDTVIYEPSQHIGRKIGGVRRLVGLSQTALGEKLGITKQAVSKLEQSEQVDDARLKKIADALGVTEEGLKKFNEEKVIYNTVNFYENCGVQTQSVNANVETLNHFSMDQAIKLFEELLKMDKNKFDKIQKGKK